MTRTWATVAVLAVATGCYRPPPHGPGVVHGRVTVGGRPAPAGSVLLVTDDRRWATVGMLSAAGEFVVADVPVGPVRAAVRTRGVKPAGGADPVRVPRRFEDPATSGLRFEVTAGEQSVELPVPAE